MEKKYLPLIYNLPAAKVFLNIFGLTLEDVEEVQEDSRVKIFYKDEKVGELIFFDGKVHISAEFDGYKLRSESPLAYGDLLFGLRNDIKCEIKKDDILINGEILIDGDPAHCRPQLKFKNKDSEVSILMWRDGKVCELNIEQGNVSETIQIGSYCVADGLNAHSINIGKYDETIFSYPYEYNAGVYYYKGDQEIVFKIQKEDECLKSPKMHYLYDLVPAAGDMNSNETIIQRGLLFQQLDPSAFRRINELREKLLVGDTHILDNLFGACFSTYPDELFKASFSFERPRMIFQDGTDTLGDSLKQGLPKGYQKSLNS